MIVRNSSNIRSTGRKHSNGSRKKHGRLQYWRAPEDLRSPSRLSIPVTTSSAHTEHKSNVKYSKPKKFVGAEIRTCLSDSGMSKSRACAIVVHSAALLLEVCVAVSEVSESKLKQSESELKP